MRRGSKPSKAKVGAKPSVVHRKDGSSRVRDLEKRLAEAQDQQAATSEVLKVIGRSTFDLTSVLHTLVENATRLCAADWGLVYRFDGEVLRVVAHHGAPPYLIEWLSAGGQGAELRPGRGSVTGKAAADRQTVHVPDVLADPDYAEWPVQWYVGCRAALGVPMLRDGNLVGVFFLSRSQPAPFTQDQIELVSIFADQAVIAIENVRLFQELQEKNRALTEAHVQVTEALEQQTATSEILAVISQSPTDVQPVFDSIAASALRLCDARLCTAFRFDGELIHLVAFHHVSAEGAAAYREAYPASPGRAGGTHRAILTRTVVHIPDIREDPEYELRALARANDFGCVLSVPMLHDGQPVGAITVGR